MELCRVCNLEVEIQRGLHFTVCTFFVTYDEKLYYVPAVQLLQYSI